MAEPKPLLLLDNITVRFQDQKLFSNLNFSVQKGEQWALVGEHNSGKEDLLKAIAGKYNITGGAIRHFYYEEYVRKNPPDDPYFTYHNLLALVSQKHNFKNLSNTSDFYYQQRYNSSDAEDAPIVEDYLSAIVSKEKQPLEWTYHKAVQTFKLESLLDKQLIKLSNGETKRLLLAAAVLKNPLLLLLDSPLTGLDVETRAELNRIISDIIASGINVIMTSSPAEIPDAITHAAILEEGEIINTLPKEDFDPQQVEVSPVTSPEQTELQELLSFAAPANYEFIVQMEEVSVRYGNQQILDKVNWHIRPGERWALLGPNGAGKSTLLSLINGDNPQSYANKITLFDRRRGSGESIWDIKKKTGFVSPEFYQYFPLGSTCLQVVESGFYDTLGLFRKSQPQNANIAIRWMRLLEIEQYAEKQLNKLSTDIQRLCLLARAVVKNPLLLILDEPCQGLDRHQQEQFKQLIDAICTNSNTTLIYVTHYKHEIPECVTKTLRLEKGRVMTEN